MSVFACAVVFVLLFSHCPGFRIGYFVCGIIGILKKILPGILFVG